MDGLNVKFEDVDYLGQAENARLVTKAKLGWIFLNNEEIIIAQRNQCIVLSKPDS